MNELQFNLSLSKDAMRLIIESCRMNPEAKELCNALTSDYHKALLYERMNDIIDAGLSECDFDYDKTN